LRATSFVVYPNGADPSDSLQVYHSLHGLRPWGDSMIDSSSGLPTKFWSSGDPAAGTGWVASNPTHPHWVLASGPFHLAPGDTQVVDAALVVGWGPNHLASTAVLRANAAEVRRLFDDHFASLNRSIPRAGAAGHPDQEFTQSFDRVHEADLSRSERRRRGRDRSLRSLGPQAPNPGGSLAASGTPGGGVGWHRRRRSSAPSGPLLRPRIGRGREKLGSHRPGTLGACPSSPKSKRSAATSKPRSSAGLSRAPASRARSSARRSRAALALAFAAAASRRSGATARSSSSTSRVARA